MEFLSPTNRAQGVVDLTTESPAAEPEDPLYDAAFIESLKIGEFYQCRSLGSKDWDLSVLQQVDALQDGSLVALIKWCSSSAKQVVPITPDTFRLISKKRDRKSKFNLFDEENHLRDIIGMKKLKKNTVVEDLTTPVKGEKHEVVHRPLKPGMLSVDIVHEAAAKCAYSLYTHANALIPFISPKVYAQLISFESPAQARSSNSPELYFKVEPDVVTVESPQDAALPAVDSISSLCSLASFRDQPVPEMLSPARPPFHAMPKTAMDATPAQISVPGTIKATLRDYQVRGVSWLVDRYDRCINCILADEMGLGKTLQTICFFAYLKEVRREGGPHLVVVPLSVMFNWITELKKFCPTLRVLRAHSNQPTECKNLRERLQDVSQYDVVVTSYEMLKGSMELTFQRMVWRTVTLDEGHRIKNMLTQLSKVCIKLRARFKLILTGTPVQNNLSETYSLLHYLAPTVFDTDCGAAFATCFSLNAGSSAAGSDDNADGQSSKHPTGAKLTKMQIDRQVLNAAHYMLRPFVLRRVKTEVEQKLPPKLETLIKCPLSDMQRFWIKALLMRESTALMGHFATHTEANAEQAENSQFWKRLQSLLAQLRKAANHPYLFSGVESKTTEDSLASEEIVTASGKMVMLDRLLHKLHAIGHRVVLFSQFTKTLDIITDYLEMRGYNHCRLDGSTHRVMREVLINQFNKPKSPLFIFCLSTRAGGEGVNLFTADTVILFDSDWNPQVDIQAMARVHRIGQTRPVHIYRLVSQGTVEERIVQRAQKKLFLDCMVNRGSTAQGQEIDRQVEEARRLRALQHQAAATAGFSNIVGNGDDSDAADVPSDAASASSTAANTAGCITSAAAAAMKEEGGEDLDTSTAMAALKFGWNACFSGNTGADGNCNISDEALDAIIDRTRRSNTAVTQMLEREQTSQSQTQSVAHSQSNSHGNSQSHQHSKGSSQAARVKMPKGKPEPMYQASDSMVKKARSILSSTSSASRSHGSEDGDADDLRGGSVLAGKVLFADDDGPTKAGIGIRATSSSGIAIPGKPSTAPATKTANADKFLQEGQETSVTEFEEATPLVELRCFEGEVLSSKKQVTSMSDISSLWIIQQKENEVRAKRDRQFRLEQVHVTNVGMVSVLKANNYTLEDGEPSVFDAEARRHKEWALAVRADDKKKRKTFKHQDHCQHCWDYGKLICCTYCPASYHLKCVGLQKVPTSSWSCPHHAECATCGQSNKQMSFFFRCEMCSNSYCEDCLPADHQVTGFCERWARLGYATPGNACYIYCSDGCAKFAAHQEAHTNSSGASEDDDVIVIQDSATKALRK